MRNLKRVLSLTLASVMLLGMMVVGTSAVGYSDVDYSKDNIEAIEVMNALGIMVGDEGTDLFRPTSEVTRAEMAKIMATLLHLNVQYYEGTHPFADSVGHWAENYIAACSANGVINGRVAGVTFDPAAGVTAIEASAMLMRAMGYFKYASDLQGGFEVATVSQGTKIGIYRNIDGSAYAPMTRAQVAQIVLNALQCSMVDAKNTGSTITTPDGTVINTGNTTYEVRYVTDNLNSKYAQINNSSRNAGLSTADFSVELGEELYDGKLQLLAATADVFRRPATQWRYNNRTIGTYAKEPDLTYTKGVKGKDIWADLGRPLTINDTYYTLDGDTMGTVAGAAYSVASGGSNNIYNTNKGVLTEVYYDAQKLTVTVISIGTYLAKVLSDYDEGTDTLAIQVKAQGLLNNGKSFPSELDGEDFAISGYKKGDYLTVTANYDGSKYVIQSVAPATVVEGVKISQYRDSDFITAGGKNYDLSYNVTWDTAVLGKDLLNKGKMTGGAISLQEVEYDLYLDPYGYIIGMDNNGQGTNLGNYLFVEAAKSMGMSAEAKAIFMDGTSATIKITKTAGATGEFKDVGKGTVHPAGTASAASAAGDLRPGHFYTYTKASDGSYQLRDAGNTQGWVYGGAYGLDPDAYDVSHPIVYANGDDTNASKYKAGSELPVSNSKTVFIADETLYVGVKNVPKVKVDRSANTNNLYYMYSNDSTYLAAVVTASKGNAAANAANYILVYKGADTGNMGQDDDGTQYFLADGVMNGKLYKDKNALKISQSSSISNDVYMGLYKIESYDGDYPEIQAEAGSYVSAHDANCLVMDQVYSIHLADTAIKNGYTAGSLGLNGTYYTLDEDTLIYRVDSNSAYDSVSDVFVMSMDIIENLPKSGNNGAYGYDIFLVMREDDKNVVALAYFVKIG